MSKKIEKKIKDPDIDKSIAENVGREKCVFLLFVTGNSPASSRAIINCKAICDKYLKGRYKLDIIDINEQPYKAIVEEIIALPVLIRKLPLPKMRMIGDLSDVQEVLDGFNIV